MKGEMLASVPDYIAAQTLLGLIKNPV